MSSKLTEDERQVLAEEGVSLPRIGKKRNREKPAPSQSSERSTSGTDHEREWQEVRKYLVPNPHLKANDERNSIQKVG